MYKTNIKPSYYCKNCDYKLKEEDKICPNCGGGERLIKMNLYGEITPHSNIGARKFIKGIKSWVKEVISGWFPSKDTDKHPQGVDKTRIIDRENPKDLESYQEKITDIKKGKITRDIKEPLEKHRHK